MKRFRNAAGAALVLLLLVALAAGTVAKRGSTEARSAKRINPSAELNGAKGLIPYGAAGVSESGEASGLAESSGAAQQDYAARVRSTSTSSGRSTSSVGRSVRAA